MELLLLFQRESLPRRNFEVIPRRTFDIISEEPLNLFREEPLILFWMKIFKSIRINRFRAVTWPSPVLKILKVSVSNTFSIHDFVGSKGLEPSPGQVKVWKFYGCRFGTRFYR